MTISAGIEAMIDQAMATGHYACREDVLRHALEALRFQREALVYDEDAVAGIERGLADIAAGRHKTFEDFDRDFRARHGIELSEAEIAVEAIQVSMDDILAGRVQPAKEFDEEFETRKGIGKSPANILRIAHQDAQAVYHDLSGFKITLTPCADGWHVDYELTDPLSARGGPHYMIHAGTGRILVRRYEQ